MIAATEQGPTETWSPGDAAVTPPMDHETKPQADEQERAEREEYWNGVLTGDLYQIPKEVREKIEAMHPLGMVSDERMAGRIMQSWAADMGGLTPEQVKGEWPRLRERLAAQYGATGESDYELFVAVSDHNRVRLDQRRALMKLYNESYDRTLSASGRAPESGNDKFTVLRGKELQSIARAVEKRAVAHALDDSRRLSESAATVLAGLQGLVEGERPNRDLKRRFLRNPVNCAVDVAKAVAELNRLSDEDRAKVYRMMSPYVRDTPGFAQALNMALTRGVSNVGGNLAQLGMNGVAWALPKEWGKEAVAGAAERFEELRKFAAMQYAPLYDAEKTPWFRRMLVDMAEGGASTALAFCGPYGLATLMGSESGRNMADARQMNPEGDFNAQMLGAVSSGGVNTALSYGMSKLGQRILGQSMRGFRALSPGKTNLKLLKEVVKNVAGDAALMTAENKMTELSPMLAQEAVGAATGKESGVDWAGWQERQLSAEAQMTEAAMMAPFLLIGARKSMLGHFRRPEQILGGGAPLRVFGIPQEMIERIMELSRTDVRGAGELLRSSLAQSPLWGTPYLNRKAVEWSRALSEDGEPFFRTEQEAREFLDLPSPVRTQPWRGKTEAQADAALRNLSGDADFLRAAAGWMRRAGLPQAEAAAGDARGAGKSKPARRHRSADETLEDWYEELNRREELDLNILSEGAGGGLPRRLVRAEQYDPQADEVRMAFLEDRLKRRAHRPYQMLLLAYPAEAGAPPRQADWDAITVDMDVRTRANTHEGVMELVYGIPQAEVNRHVARRFWQSFCRDEQGAARAQGLLAEGAQALRAPELNQGGAAGKDVCSALVEMSERMARADDAARHSVSPELRQLNRMVWEAQAEVKSLFGLLPNLKEFDAYCGRGFSPEQTFSLMLSRMLETTPAQVAKLADTLEHEKLVLSEKPAGVIAYKGTEDVTRNLAHTFTQAYRTRRAGEQEWWSARYPDGKWSHWHDSKAGADADLMARVALMFSPACKTKTDMFREWQMLTRYNEPAWNHISMSLGDRSAGRDVTLYDKLTRVAMADMLQAGYGGRGDVAPGESLVVTRRGRIAAEGVMSPDAIEARKAAYAAHVGAIEKLGVDASNEPLPTARGLVRNRLTLHNADNPLALIEDKAEVAWDRLIRTSQLSADEAWDMLRGMNRVKDRRFKGETELFEELSQLSKEYFFANLDHGNIPRSVAAWARYGIAMPSKADAQLLKLAQQGNELRRALEERPLPQELMSMLQETVGMNDRIRMERLWAQDEPQERLNMMERYAHGLMNGRLLRCVPAHVRADLTQALAGKNMSGARAERVAAQRLEELRRALLEFPDLNAWRMEPDKPGRYMKLMPIRAEYNPAPDWNAPLPEPSAEPPAPQKGALRRNLPAPQEWRDRADVIGALRTLETVRQDFAARPVATQDGVVWQGRLFRADSPDAPRGVGADWGREVPLMDSIRLIDAIDKRRAEIKGGYIPFLPEPAEAVEHYGSCVTYRDPNDAGHTVRLMPGIPECALRECRAPYVVHAWNGVYLDKDGRAARTERDSYIPLELFTGAAEEPTPAQSREARQKYRERILDTLCAPAAQERNWWHPQDACGSLTEDVIRLYEELGIRADLMSGKLQLTDPVAVTALRFVARILDDPMSFRHSVDRKAALRDAVTEEGRFLQALMQNYE